MNQRNYRQPIDSPNRLPLIIALGVGLFVLVLVIIVLVIISVTKKVNVEAGSVANVFTEAAKSAQYSTATKNAEGAAIVASLEKNSSGTVTALTYQLTQVAMGRTAIASGTYPPTVTAAGTYPSNGSATARITGAAPTLPPTVAGGAKRPVLHLVRASDSLATMAKQYNTSVRAIVEANRNAATLGNPSTLIVNPDALAPTIYEGSQLVIPVGRQEFKGYALLYSDGMDLKQLGANSNISLTELLNYNGITSLTEIKKGEPLLIPTK